MSSKNVLRPPRDTGARYKDVKLVLPLWGQLRLMKMFLIKYVDHLSGQAPWNLMFGVQQPWRWPRWQCRGVG